MTKKVLMLHVTIFNSHLQITYLPSDMHSHSLRKMITGEELPSIRHSKIERKNWKAIVDSESCVNAVSSKMIKKGWLEGCTSSPSV